MSYDWPREMIDVVTALWFEGHSASEIGRRVGLTKGQVIGKIGRMGLPGRPSPIKRDCPPKPVKPKRVKQHQPTLMKLIAVAETEEPEQPPLRVHEPDPCCYIVRGEGRRAVYCDAPTIARSPYCAGHHVRTHARQLA